MAGPALVVIPTYNEAENIRGIVTAVLGLPEGLDVLVVDDGSPDGTGELAEDLGRETGGRVTVLHRAGKLGLGTAYLDGFRRGLAAGYPVLVQMDADFSHDPGYLPGMLLAVGRADLVLGSRYARGGGTRNWGLARKLISRRAFS